MDRSPAESIRGYEEIKVAISWLWKWWDSKVSKLQNKFYRWGVVRGLCTQLLSMDEPYVKWASHCIWPCAIMSYTWFKSLTVFLRMESISKACLQRFENSSHNLLVNNELSRRKLDAIRFAQRYIRNTVLHSSISQSSLYSVHFLRFI